MKGTHITGANEQLRKLMDGTVNGMSKFQATPPGTSARSEREKKEIYEKINSMNPEEQGVKLAEIIALIGEDQLTKFLVEQAKKK